MSVSFSSFHFFAGLCFADNSLTGINAALAEENRRLHLEAQEIMVGLFPKGKNKTFAIDRSPPGIVGLLCK